MPDTASPASPTALAALSGYLDGFDDRIRSRGRDYFKDGRVRSLRCTGPEVTALVRGSTHYQVVLVWANGRWESECTCPTEFACKHVYATGLAWSRQSDRREPAAPVAEAVGLAAAAAAARPWQPSEEPLVAEFAAAAGQTPDRQQLAWLRNLAAAHRSLQQFSGTWFDGSALATLAPAGDRQWLRQNFANPFTGWWSQPPATPLQLWPFIALLFTERGIALPDFTAPFDHLERARQARDAAQREAQLRAWRHRFSQLDQLAALPVPPAVRQSLRLRLGTKKWVWELSPRGPGGPFKALPATALRSLLHDPVASAQKLDDPANALLAFLRPNLAARGRSTLAPGDEEDRILVGLMLAHPRARESLVTEAGGPLTDDPRPLTWRVDDHPADPELVVVRLALADGTAPPGPLLYLPAQPAFYLHQPTGALFRGLRPIQEPAHGFSDDFATAVPRAVLALPEAGRFAARAGVQLPGDIAGRFRAEPLRARLRVQLVPRRERNPDEVLVVELHAVSPAGAARARWQPDGWQTGAAGLERPADAAYVLHDYGPLQPAAEHLARLPGLGWEAWPPGAGRFSSEITASTFPENLAEWLAAVPAGTLIELGPELAALAAPPTQGRFELQVTENGIDWFDVRVSLRVEDTTLTAAEIALLRKAHGRFVRLAGRGWRRLEVAVGAQERDRLERLGLDPAAADEPARETPRFHALQLADETLGDALPEKLWRQIRDRAASIRSVPPPPLPEGLRAEMRPYQIEGFHFLAHLAENRFGGVLADDMGLGKTVQTLAWLLWLAARARAGGRQFRALVVCPKSVVVNWQLETARFAPSLTTGRLSPGARKPVPAGAQLVVVNYAQLRLNAAALAGEAWDAVVLDEGQNIKNPASATAQAARVLRATHRIVLTGTPVENRLLDLWSLFAFAQPGLLGGPTAFKRRYNDKADPAAHGRLAARVRHFLLRRTKGQVARDLPARTEEDLVVELDGSQRALYDAELKRARQLLLGVKSAREFDAQRFNILQSLLRLRQICCDPRLVGAELGAAARPGRRRKAGEDPADASPDRASAKLDALLDTLEPLLAEGHRVLVFSQFVTMLELIRPELAARDIPYLMLTGQTENRQELVDQFQAPGGPPVFLLSLKAAGSGLNLTAASYVVLYDPWWNPAVEAQAIDRTHRIGQTAHVIAYRLLARDTVEEKIRALQKEKAALAAAVVQEESLASVLDLESLKRILA